MDLWNVRKLKFQIFLCVVTVLQGEDPATVLVKKKLLWKHQVRVYKGQYRTQKKSKQSHTDVKNILFVIDFLFSTTYTIFLI